MLKRQRVPLALASIVIASTVVGSKTTLADEGGVGFWLPGTFGSLSAVPLSPGLSLAAFYDHTSVSAGADVTRSREFEIGRLSPTLNVNLSAKIHGDLDFVFLNPTYVFPSPVLGGQAAVGMGTLIGNSSASLSGTLTASLPPFALVRSDNISGQVFGNGDLYPQASLKWNQETNNFMIYGTGDIPVGRYSSTRLANLGIGHGAVDVGGGYTYLDPENGHELSAVGGFTYNLINSATNYQNGVDFHLDWGVSQFLSQQLHVGLVGYLYDQVSADSGPGDFVGSFKSRVVGIGPQIGYIVPLGATQGYLNLKGYGEFDARSRPSGYNIWLTFAISPSPPSKP